jgi:heme/copper-type cytochrome/quinol oxidase subunit 4
MKKYIIVFAISIAFFGLAMWLENKWDLSEKIG